MKRLLVFLTAIAFVAGMALPAFAADWSFYGSARVKSYFQWEDKADKKFEQLDFDMQGNSRIGARVKASDAVSGQFEFAVAPANVGTRILLGHWNFGPGTFSVGQGYTPVDIFYSTQAHNTDNGLLTHGEAYTGRHAMLQLSMAGFKIAAVKVHGAEVRDGAGGPAAGGRRLAKVPKLELSYGQSFGLVSFDVMGGYQWYKYEVGNHEHDVDAYMIGAGVWVKPGPARIGLVGHWERNGAQFGLSYWHNDPYNLGFASARFDGNKIIDNDAWAAGAIVGFKATNMLDFEAGYGYAESKMDVTDAKKMESHNVYVQASITLAPGVFVVPGYGYYENKYEGKDDQKTHYVGAKWQINF